MSTPFYQNYQNTACAIFQRRNTPDFLKTGGESCTVAAEPGDLCPKQTALEYTTEFTMWAMASAPLLISTDVRNLTAIQKLVLNTEVIAVDQQPVAGDVAQEVTCIPTSIAATTSGGRGDGNDGNGGGDGDGSSAAAAVDLRLASPLPPVGSWFVLKDSDALPDRPVTTHGVFFEYGETPDGAACQAACSKNATCTIYEWSGKSSNCWWRLDGKWEVRQGVVERESGCIVGKVSGCGTTPPPPPPPSPPPPQPKGSSCSVWTKPLSETTYPGTAGWSNLKSHHAVVLLNVGEAPAIIAADLSLLLLSSGSMDSASASTSFLVRDVWENRSLGTFTGSVNATVMPHEAKLLRVYVV